jgi:hypothetical protein
MDDVDIDIATGWLCKVIVKSFKSLGKTILIEITHWVSVYINMILNIRLGLKCLSVTYTQSYNTKFSLRFIKMDLKHRVKLFFKLVYILLIFKCRHDLK